MIFKKGDIVSYNSYDCNFFLASEWTVIGTYGSTVTITHIDIEGVNGGNIRIRVPSDRFILITKKEEMSDPKKVVINIPDGYVIDKDKSTFEEIVFKEIVIQPVDRFEELDSISGYYVSEKARIFSIFNVNPEKHHRNTFPTKKDAESSIALSMLLQLRKEVVGDWEPDYTDEVLKFTIRRYGNDINIFQSDCYYCPLSFPDSIMAEVFFKKHEYLIGTYYQL